MASSGAKLGQSRRSFLWGAHGGWEETKEAEGGESSASTFGFGRNLGAVPLFVKIQKDHDREVVNCIARSSN